jgi:RNA polymerase sigma-32 factor
MQKKTLKNRGKLIHLPPKNVLVPSKNKGVRRYLPSPSEQLTLYLKQIRKYDLLSESQEEVLTKSLVKTGDIEIAKKLVLHNLRLVVKIALEYRTAYQNVMDLIQEGNIGLMKAVSKYDRSKGAKLSYYASWWIRSYILKFILENFRLVKIGTSNEQKKLFYNLLREKNRLAGLGIDPEPKLLAQNLGVSEKSVDLMEKRLGETGGEVSLDIPIGMERGEHLLQDILPDTNGKTPEEIFSDTQDLEILKSHLNQFVATLNPRDKEIFKKRLLSEVPSSLQSIADEYGVTRERIRQIESRLIENLKVYMSDFIR